MIQIGCYQDVQANCSPVPTTSHTSPRNLLQILVFCYVDDICNGGNRCTYKGTGGAGCRSLQLLQLTVTCIRICIYKVVTDVHCTYMETGVADCRW